MKVTTIHRKNTGYFSQQQLDMCYNQQHYAEFIAQPFSVAAFEQQLRVKKNTYSMEMRQQLVQAIKQQYANIALSDKVAHHLDLLAKENTFTVVTGHQLVAMTGPLYFVYKIAHVVRMCTELSQKYTDSQFVPVFWMATEDHDYEEIKSFHLFNRTLTWETTQKGPVGRFDLTGWQEVLDQLKELFANHPQSDVFAWMEQLKGDNYAAAFRRLVNFLFEKYGVVIIDGDDAQLKQAFVLIMQKEVLEQFAFPAIQATTERLVVHGGKQQVMPREYNLFYIENGMRERLIPKGDAIEIPQKGIFSKQEVAEWIARSPQNFSPNASMRPLYQEVLLPNLCYIGGAGEINYWLQLKGVFDAVDVPFPLLKTRNSLLWIDAATQGKMEQLGWTTDDLFKETHQLTAAYLEKNAGDAIDFSPIQAHVEVLKNTVIETFHSAEPSMDSYVMAELVKLDKQMKQLEDQLVKASKRQHEKALKTIKQVKERLFPAGGLQERTTNLLQLTPDGNFKPLIDAIVASIQPFSDDFLVVEEK
ncbi:MAG: bacillithiol biosynthesis cysteine-adding enzyme BshC [Crocinitomicaceae bacterium]